MDALKSRPLIHGEGTPEEHWRPWLNGWRVRRLDLQDVLPASKRLVVVAPHPDDEVLGCGALIAMHAGRGGRCLVVGVTDGEASHHGIVGCDPVELRLTRVQERLRGLMALGLSSAAVLRLQLPDGRIAEHEAILTACVRGVLRPGDIVVTTWHRDGHPDHDATGRATRAAAAAKACICLEMPVWMWHWAVPADIRVPWSCLRSLPVSDQVREAVHTAVASHATQVLPRTAAQPVLNHEIRQRALRSTGYLFV